MGKATIDRRWLPLNALFRSWLIERFGNGAATGTFNIHLAVSNE